MAGKTRKIIKAELLYDGYSRKKDVTIVIEGERIVEVGKSRSKPDFKGIVTPAFIDPHSHIGMFREGEPSAESEGNDRSTQIQPLTTPLNSVYYDDRAFRDSIDFGVLYSCIIPGSGNLFGGRAQTIRHKAKHTGEALIDNYGYKMALGYNPRSTTDWKGERPNTRMGIYAMLEKRFDGILNKVEKTELERERKEAELARKVEKKDLSQKLADNETTRIRREAELALSSEEHAIAEALSGRKPIKVHVHKEDDVIYLIHLKKKYGLKVTAEHTSDVYHKEIFKLLAKEGVPIVYGPIGSLSYKVELQHSFYQNAKLLMDSGAEFGLMTDHPVIHVTALRDSLKYFLIAGMNDTDAISLISRRNAEILNLLPDRGVIKEGAYADLLVWNKDPLHLSAMPSVVIGEGEVLRKRKL